MPKRKLRTCKDEPGAQGGGAKGHAHGQVGRDADHDHADVGKGGCGDDEVDEVEEELARIKLQTPYSKESSMWRQMNTTTPLSSPSLRLVGTNFALTRLPAMRIFDSHCELVTARQLVNTCCDSV